MIVFYKNKLINFQYLLIISTLCFPQISFSMNRPETVAVIGHLIEAAHDYYNLYTTVTTAVEIYQSSQMHQDVDTHRSNSPKRQQESLETWQMVNDLSQTSQHGHTLAHANDFVSSIAFRQETSHDKTIDHSSTTTSTSKHDASDINKEIVSEMRSSAAPLSTLESTQLVASITHDFKDIECHLKEAISANNSEPDRYFASETTADNRHAISLENQSQQYDYETTYIKPASNRAIELAKSKKQEIELNTLNEIFSYSNNIKTIKIQIAAALDNLRSEINYQVSTCSSIQLRDFFFDQEGHFKPINSEERQEEAVRILAPAIQTHFAEKNMEGYGKYLKENATKNIPGFRALYSAYNSTARYITHSVKEAGRSFLSGFTFHRIPRVREIKNGEFVATFSKFISLCETGHHSEAKRYIENLQNLPLKDSKLTRKELNCLADAARALAEKNTIKLEPKNSVTLQQSVEQSKDVNKDQEALQPKNNEVLTHNKNDEETKEVAKNSSFKVEVEGELASPPAPQPTRDPEKNKEKESNQKTQELYHITFSKLENDSEYKQFVRTVEKARLNSPNKEIKNYYSNDVDLEKLQKIDKYAEIKYQKIRENTEDIEKIAYNTQICPTYLKIIKDHVFNNEHILESGINNFSPDLNIAETWERLVENNFVDNDFEWLLHEFTEAKISEHHSMDHRMAHDIVNLRYNWQDLLK